MESVSHRIESAGEKLVQGLLFVNEAPLMQSINGEHRYAEEFREQGPFDKKGRSLRDFDLNRRLFKYPCSYLIYSESFDELPPAMKTFVANRLHEILAGPGDEPYSQLPADDRLAIFEIIQDTNRAFGKRPAKCLMAPQHPSLRCDIALRRGNWLPVVEGQRCGRIDNAVDVLKS